MKEVQVVVAHNERATVRVGDLFVKIDGDQARSDIEARALTIAPVPTPQIVWKQPHALALSALRGQPLARLGEPSTAPPSAWAAAGAAIRSLHDAPVPPWPGMTLDKTTASLADECEWLIANNVVPADVVGRNMQIAQRALRPWTPVFIHGDLQVAHVFVQGDDVAGIIDWSDAGPGDAHYDLAILTLGHEEHVDDVLTGYGTDVDREVIRGWWSVRSLQAIRWLIDHGFDPAPEIAVLTSRS